MQDTRKNFKKLKAGAWYRLRNGTATQAETYRGKLISLNALLYEENGKCRGFTTEYDVIEEIYPPIITPIEGQIE